MITQLEPVNSEGRARFHCDQCGLTTGPLRPEYIHKLSCCCPRPTPAPPGLLARAANFLRDSVAHARNHFTKAPDDVREARLATCHACPLFDGTICTHRKCGCCIKKKRSWFDKLSWASSKCPIGKWTAHPQA